MTLHRVQQLACITQRVRHSYHMANDAVWKVFLSVDGTERVSREFVRFDVAEKAYYRALALYGLGGRAPQTTGRAVLRQCIAPFEQRQSAEWRPGFGWY